MLSNDTNKKRNFVETIELQIKLRDYNTKKDTRFKGSIILDHAPYPNLPIAILGNVDHCDEAKSLGLDCLNQDQMKAFKKDKKGIKAWASKYKVLLASQKLIRTVTRTMGRQLNKCGKVPIPIREGESITAKHEILKRTIKFQLKKCVDLGVAIGKEGMSQEQVIQNLTKAINFLVSLTKKGWQNIETLHIKRTMSRSYRIYG